jgi:hypothetical protein
MTDDLKPPQVGELTLPRWQYWLARYNEVLGERERRIAKLEAALARIAKHDMQAIAMDALRPSERVREALNTSAERVKNNGET